MRVSKELYLDVKDNKEKYSDFLVGYIGFELSFSAKFFCGYVTCDDSKHRGDIYSHKHCMKQAENLKGIEFYCADFQTIKDLHNCVIYCDPPYRGTTKYEVEKFQYDEFYDWCRKMAKDNVVLVSEYNMPSDFKCVWQKETKVTLSKQRVAKDETDKRVEKLFIIGDQIGLPGK